MKDKILIVASNFYEKVSNNLLNGTTIYLDENGYDYETIFAPGCFEIPFLVKQNIDNYIGFIVLGCVIRGETISLWKFYLMSVLEKLWIYLLIIKNL